MSPLTEFPPFKADPQTVSKTPSTAMTAETIFECFTFSLNCEPTNSNVNGACKERMITTLVRVVSWIAW